MTRANPRAEECLQVRQMRWIRIAFAIDADVNRRIFLQVVEDEMRRCEENFGITAFISALLRDLWPIS
jgi:hypothetical protein